MRKKSEKKNLHSSVEKCSQTPPTLLDVLNIIWSLSPEGRGSRGVFIVNTKREKEKKEKKRDISGGWR